MLYTANVNRFLWYFFVPFLIIFYLGFLVWSYENYTNKPVYEAIKNKQQVVNSLEYFDGIILGGSNAWYGLSAKSLGTLSNSTWINLTAPAEGYSDENYFNFMTNSISYKKRQNVSFIIYSSNSLATKNLKKRNNTSTDLVGKNKIAYQPQRSLASYLKDSLGYTKFREYPVEEYGDFGFDNYPCGKFIPTPFKPREYLNDSDLHEWMAHKIINLSELFPNAKLIITIPNGFNKNLRQPDDEGRRKLVEELENILNKHLQSGKESIYLTSQSPYPSSDLMCRDNWHANEAGRQWRTNKLYQLIKDQLYIHHGAADDIN